MGRQSAGLVLRAKSVDAFHAVRGLGGVKVSKFVSVPLTGTDDISVSEAIRQAVTDAGVRTGRVAVNVPSQDIILRAFLLPLLPKSEWTPAVQFETRKHIPFKMEELVWGYYALEQRATKQLAVTFAGIRIDRLAQIRRWLSLAGVKPALVEAQAISLARLAAPTTPGVGNQFAGIVDIDQHANTAHIVITKQQVPYLSREIVLKTDALASAELAPELRATTPEGIDPRVEILLSELRLSFDFFIREHPKAIIHQVCLFGDEAIVGPWSGWLAQQLPCPVMLGRLSQLPGLEQFGLGRASAAGLALGELSTHPVKLDFLVPPLSLSSSATRPADLLQAFTVSPDVVQQLVRTLGLQVVAAAVALGLMVGAVQYRLTSLRQEMNQMVRAVPDVGWGLRDVSMERLQTMHDQVEKHLGFLRQAVQHRVPVTEKLDRLVKALPDGVWLDGVEYDDRLEISGASQHNLRLKGYCFLGGKAAEERGVISDFVRQLKQNHDFFRGFSIAQLGAITKSHDAQTDADYQSFDVTCDSTGTRLF